MDDLWGAAIKYIEDKCYLLDIEEYKKFLHDCPAELLICVIDILQRAEINIITEISDQDSKLADCLYKLTQRFDLNRLAW